MTDLDALAADRDTLAEALAWLFANGPHDPLAIADYLLKNGPVQAVADIRRAVADEARPLAARLVHLAYDVGEIDDQDVSDRLIALAMKVKEIGIEGGGYGDVDITVFGA